MTRGYWPPCCQSRWGSCVLAGRTSSSSPSTTAASGWPRPPSGQCPGRTPRSDAGLTAASAAVEFAAWLRARIPGQLEPPENLDELVRELADSWNLNSIDAV